MSICPPQRKRVSLGLHVVWAFFVRSNTRSSRQGCLRGHGGGPDRIATSKSSYSSGNTAVIVPQLGDARLNCTIGFNVNWRYSCSRMG